MPNYTCLLTIVLVIVVATSIVHGETVSKVVPPNESTPESTVARTEVVPRALDPKENLDNCSQPVEPEEPEEPVVEEVPEPPKEEPCPDKGMPLRPHHTIDATVEDADAADNLDHDDAESLGMKHAGASPLQENPSFAPITGPGFEEKNDYNGEDLDEVLGHSDNENMFHGESPPPPPPSSVDPASKSKAVKQAEEEEEDDETMVTKSSTVDDATNRWAPREGQYSDTMPGSEDSDAVPEDSQPEPLPNVSGSFTGHNVASPLRLVSEKAISELSKKQADVVLRERHLKELETHISKTISGFEARSKSLDDKETEVERKQRELLELIAHLKNLRGKTDPEPQRPAIPEPPAIRWVQVPEIPSFQDEDIGHEVSDSVHDNTSTPHSQVPETQKPVKKLHHGGFHEDTSFEAQAKQQMLKPEPRFNMSTEWVRRLRDFSGWRNLRSSMEADRPRTRAPVPSPTNIDEAQDKADGICRNSRGEIVSCDIHEIRKNAEINRKEITLNHTTSIETHWLNTSCNGTEANIRASIENTTNVPQPGAQMRTSAKKLSGDAALSATGCTIRCRYFSNRQNMMEIRLEAGHEQPTQCPLFHKGMPLANCGLIHLPSYQGKCSLDCVYDGSSNPLNDERDTANTFPSSKTAIVDERSKRVSDLEARSLAYTWYDLSGRKDCAATSARDPLVTCRVVPEQSQEVIVPSL